MNTRCKIKSLHLPWKNPQERNALTKKSFPFLYLHLNFHTWERKVSIYLDSCIHSIQIFTNCCLQTKLANISKNIILYISSLHNSSISNLTLVEGGIKREHKEMWRIFADGRNWKEVTCLTFLNDNAPAKIEFENI